MKSKIILLVSLATFSSISLQAQEAAAPAHRAVAVFAGGCFWCMEPSYDKFDAVIATFSGYTGGRVENPTYEQVSAGGTGHAEAVQVVYDPKKISYKKLLDVFWHNIDPLDAGGQFCDRGSSYRSAIFYADQKQRRLAQDSKQALQKSARFRQPIATDIVPLGEFYKAENYHQNYYQKNALRYKYYRWLCGRDARLKELWEEQHNGT